LESSEAPVDEEAVEGEEIYEASAEAAGEERVTAE